MGRNVVAASGVVVAAAALLLLEPKVRGIPRSGVWATAEILGLIVAGGTLWLFRMWRSAVFAMLAATGLGAVVAATSRDATIDQRLIAGVLLPLILPMLSAMFEHRASVIVVALVGGLAAGVGHALLYDPFLDPGCTVDCVRSSLAVAHNIRAASLLRVGGFLLAAVGLSFAAAVRSRRAIVLSAIASCGWALVVDDAIPIVLIAAGIAAVVVGSDAVRFGLDRMRLRKIVAALQAGNDLEHTLRELVGDRGLTAWYRIDGYVEPSQSSDDCNEFGRQSRFVSADGATMPPCGSDQIETLVRADGIVLAVIRHSPRFVDVSGIGAAMNGPAHLAFEVERLRAAAALQSAYLRDSRIRIVDSGEFERRRLERDIHDGAQQHLLSLAMRVQHVTEDVELDASDASVLTDCLCSIRNALEELRDLAHGLRPFPLERSGLDAALHHLGARSRVPIIIGELPGRRFDVAIERATLELVQSAVAIARGPVEVDVFEQESTLLVQVTGVDVADFDTVVADRISVVGGRLTGSARGVAAGIPCA